MDHTVKNKHFPGVFEATPLRAPRQANPGAGPSRKGRFAALFLENRPRKNLLFLLFRPLLLFFEGLFRVEIYKLEQNRADQLFYR